MTQNKPRFQTVTPAVTQPIPPTRPEDNAPKARPRFLRFLDALKVETPPATPMMSWKVEGKEWVES